MSGCCASAGDSCTPASRAKEWFRLGLALLVAGQTMVIGLAVNLSDPDPAERFAVHGLLAGLTFLVLALCGGGLFKVAWGGLRARTVLFEHFFVFGIAGSLAVSLFGSFHGRADVYYEVVAVLVGIYALGDLISKRQRRAALESLRSLVPADEVCQAVVAGGASEERPVRLMRAGDLVLVRAGARVPVDGVVVEGEAFVRQTAMTGEPFPVVVRPGSPVLAGTCSTDGALVVRAAADGWDRKLDHLVRDVERACAVPVSLRREADRFTSWLLPAVAVVAACTGFYWGVRDGAERGWVQALSVVVVACPCAMGLATPITVWRALQELAHMGFLAKSGELVERLATADFVALDKTGTLSTGAMTLVDFSVVDGVSRGEIHAAVAAVQRRSGHPIAGAFAGLGEGADAVQVVTVRVLPGMGVEAVVGENGRVYRIGNRRVVPQSEESAAAALRARWRAGASGDYEIFVLRDGALVAMGVVREVLRDGAAGLREELRGAGLSSEIWTGDMAGRAEDLGLGTALASMTPAEKSARLQEVSASGRKVLFVGDGVNDASAMAHAHAALCVEGGADLAADCAHGRVAATALPLLPRAIGVSRACMRAVRRLFVFALAYNAAGVGLAVAGYLHPIASATLMLVASLTVSWVALNFRAADAGAEFDMQRAGDAGKG